MLKIGIIGVRGYTGEELLSILLKHRNVKINYLTARVDKPIAIGKIFPKFKGKTKLICENFDTVKASELCDLLFLALPHTTSMDIAPLLLKNGKDVIDLSADYRIGDYRIYEHWYKVKHRDRANLKEAVYGLPEINSAIIRRAHFIANPGCYPTAAILALAPLFKNRLIKPGPIIIDAKSGYSGAGRKNPDDIFWSQIKDSFKPYKVDSHQHSPEITQELSKLNKEKVKIIFVPHLLPIERGILETIYVKISHKSQVTSHKLISLYKNFYREKPFIRIKEEGQFPQIKDVQHTNFCDIGVKVSEDKNWVIIISALDNLLKGASGQAVQNMNLMNGSKETEGLL